MPSCRLKTPPPPQKKALPAGNNFPPSTRLYLLSYNYIHSLLHCFSKNIVTALLDYLDLDCFIRVPQIIDVIELSSPSQLQIILGAGPPIYFFTGAAPLPIPPFAAPDSRHTHWIGERTTEHSPCSFYTSVSDDR